MKKMRLFYMVLGLLLLGTVYCYHEGYMSTWLDKKKQVQRVLASGLATTDIPPQLVYPLSKCASSVLVSELHEMDCPVPLRGDNIMEVAMSCVHRNPQLESALTMHYAQCARQVYSDFMQLQPR